MFTLCWLLPQLGEPCFSTYDSKLISSKERTSVRFHYSGKCAFFRLIRLQSASRSPCGRKHIVGIPSLRNLYWTKKAKCGSEWAVYQGGGSSGACRSLDGNWAELRAELRFSQCWTRSLTAKLRSTIVTFNSAEANPKSDFHLVLNPGLNTSQDINQWYIWGLLPLFISLKISL